MRSVAEHLAAVLDGIEPLEAVDVPLLDAVGLTLAADVVAPWPLPSFDNSSMDGYAVRAADIATASPDAPVTLPVLGDVAAGETGATVVAPGTALRIMTGAPMPEGADTVVPVERTDGGTDDREHHRVPCPRAPTSGAPARTCPPARSCSGRATSSPSGRSRCSRPSAAPTSSSYAGPTWSSSARATSSSRSAIRSSTGRSSTATGSCSSPSPARPARAPGAHRTRTTTTPSSARCSTPRCATPTSS